MAASNATSIGMKKTLGLTGVTVNAMALRWLDREAALESVCTRTWEKSDPIAELMRD